MTSDQYDKAYLFVFVCFVPFILNTHLARIINQVIIDYFCHNVYKQIHYSVRGFFIKT